ncbi:MAG: cache domain-containing protein [Desulfobacteraceae bacterium]|nr:cache domain-containing protein [Desulfobacteraceae bacterium]
MPKITISPLKSMSSRIFALASGLIIITTCLLIYTVHSQAKSELLKIQEKNATILLSSVNSAVETAHKDIIFFKNRLIEQRKQEVKNEVDIAFAVLNFFKDNAESGLISNKDAKIMAKEQIRKMRFNDGLGYFWISDTTRPHAIMQMHPIFPELEGLTMSKPEHNVITKDHEIKNLSELFYEIIEKKGEGFARYYWYRPDNINENELKPKLSFVKLFKPWNWLIATGVYIEDIERLEQEKLSNAISSLESAFNYKRVQDSGYMFLFTGKKKVLIHPSLQNQDGSGLINPSTGGYILDEIINTVKNKNKHTFFYLWDKPGKPVEKKFRKVAYLSHYEPLDWYINVTYYIDDIEKPIWNLGKYMIMVSCIMLGFSLIAAAIISKSVSSPLDKLAQSAGAVMDQDLEKINLPVIGSSETKKLARVLQKTFKKINNTTKKLKNNEENLRVTLNSIGDAVIATDIKGNITRINYVAQNLTGWSDEEALGKNISQILKLVYMEKNNPVEISVQEIFKKTSSTLLKNNLILISKDKKEYQISNSGAPIKDDNGKVIGVVFVFRDVTEEIYLHEQLRQAQKMKAIGQLAGGIAHDFNNILGGIIMTVDLLETKIEKTPQTQKYLQMIIQSSQRAADLISKLLAFARKQPEASTPVNIIKPLKEAIDIIEQTIDKRIKLKKALSEKPLFVIGDPSQLQSSFLNLLINASHAMPDGGEISITTSIIELDEFYCSYSDFQIQPGRYVKVEINDTGCGIPAKDIKLIFEPFFTTKPEGKGTGLGLSAVFGTVQQHRGAINVYSEVGSGTSFQILIPLTEEQEPLQHIDNKLPVKGQGTVLIVDDEYVMRATASTVLKELDYEVITAENGKEAIEVFKKNKTEIDLVILDMVMPEMNGKDCFIELKKISPDVRVLLSSGFAREEEVEFLKSEGVKGFIKKPFRGNELGNAVYNALKT